MYIKRVVGPVEQMQDRVFVWDIPVAQERQDGVTVCRFRRVGCVPIEFEDEKPVVYQVANLPIFASSYAQAEGYLFIFFRMMPNAENLGLYSRVPEPARENGAM